MSAVMIELDGSDPIPVPVTVGPVRLPRRAGVLADTYPEPAFVPAGLHPTDSIATDLARKNTARVLVACGPDR